MNVTKLLDALFRFQDEGPEDVPSDIALAVSALITALQNWEATTSKKA